MVIKGMLWAEHMDTMDFEALADAQVTCRYTSPVTQLGACRSVNRLQTSLSKVMLYI